MVQHSRAVGRRTELYLFLVLLLSYGYFFQGGGWHQNSRYDLVRALVEDGSVRIDRFAGNTGDVARAGGRVLSNKAPGLSFLAAPVYLATRGPLGIAREPGHPSRRQSLQVHLLVFFTVSLPSALLGVILFRFLAAWAPAPSFAPLTCVIAYALGTLAFPWSTQFMGHQTGGALLFAAAFLIFRERRRSWSGGWGPLTTAGALLGLAFLVEETAIFALPIPIVYAGCTGGWRRAAAVCLGGMGPAALLLAYNTAAFGGPLQTARHFQDPRFTSGESGLILGVIGIPSPRILLEVTILPRRGLFYYCPVLLFATVGLLAGLRHRATRPEAAAFLAIFGALLLFNSSFNGWHGGWSTGPRYLVPALPFVAAGLALVPSFLRGLACAAGGISIVLMTAVTVVNVSVPQDLSDAGTVARGVADGVEDVRDPLRNYILPRLVRGDVSVHSQHVEEGRIGQRLSRCEQAWASYNLGEWLGLRGLASLLPLALLWSAFAYRCGRERLWKAQEG